LSQQEDASAGGETESDAGGDCGRSSTEEEEGGENEGEGMMDSGSTVKEVDTEAGSSTGCGVHAGHGIGGDENKFAAAGDAKEGGDDGKTSRRAPDERATKRRRLFRAGCADVLLREPESQGAVSAATLLTPERARNLFLLAP